MTTRARRAAIRELKFLGVSAAIFLGLIVVGVLS